jgi:hypothetical protein
LEGNDQMGFPKKLISWSKLSEKSRFSIQDASLLIFSLKEKCFIEIRIQSYICTNFFV